MYLPTSMSSSSGRLFRILNSGFINTEATCILYMSFACLLAIKSGGAHVDNMLSEKFDNFSL